MSISPSECPTSLTSAPGSPKLGDIFANPGPSAQKASNEISFYLMQLCRPFIERDHNDASHGLFQLSQICHGFGGMFVLRRYFPQFARR
jgi:hypothetical protein